MDEFPDDLDLGAIEYTAVARSKRHRAPQDDDGAPGQETCSVCGAPVNAGALVCAGCGATRRGGRRWRKPKRGRKKAKQGLRQVGGKSGALAIVLVLAVGGAWAAWHFGFQRAGGVMQITKAFDLVLDGQIREGLQELEDLSYGVSEQNRDLLYLRTRQAAAFADAGGQLGLPTPAGEAPLRFTDIKVEVRGRLRAISLSIQSPGSEPVTLSADHFFFCGRRLASGRTTGTVGRTTLALLPSADVEANTLDGVQVPAGGTVEGAVGFWGLPLLGWVTNIGTDAGSNEEMRAITYTLVYNDGDRCFGAQVRMR